MSSKLYGAGVVGLIGMVLAGCGQSPDAQEAQQGLFLSSVTDTVCAANGNGIEFAVNIYSGDTCNNFAAIDANTPTALDANGDSVPTITIDPSELIDVEPLDFPTGVNGMWVAGDHFIPLPATHADGAQIDGGPGQYCVTVTPTNAVAGTQPIDYDPTDPATFHDDATPTTAFNTGIVLNEGATTETVFAFECDGETIAALDIVVLVNEGPSITDFGYGDSGKFVLTCETGEFTIEWETPSTGPVHVFCEAFDGVQSNYAYAGSTYDGDLQTFTPVPTSGNVWSDSATTNPALASTTYDNTFYPWFDGADTYYLYCNIQNSSGQITTFQSLFHVSEPASGLVCVDDDSVGMNDGEIITKPGTVTTINNGSFGDGRTITRIDRMAVYAKEDVEGNSLELMGYKAEDEFHDLVHYGAARVALVDDGENAISELWAITAVSQGQGTGRIRFNADGTLGGEGFDVVFGKEEFLNDRWQFIEVATLAVPVDGARLYTTERDKLQRLEIYADAAIAPAGTTADRIDMSVATGYYGLLSCDPDDYIPLDPTCLGESVDGLTPCDEVCQ